MERRKFIKSAAIIGGSLLLPDMSVLASVHEKEEKETVAGLTKLSDSIYLACNCLKSHDLIGLDIILASFSNSNIQREIKNYKIYDTVVRVIGLTKDIKEIYDRNNNDALAYLYIKPKKNNHSIHWVVILDIEADID